MHVAGHLSHADSVSAVREQPPKKRNRLKVLALATVTTAEKSVFPTPETGS